MITIKFEIEREFDNQTEVKQFKKTYSSDTINKDDLLNDFEYFLLEFSNDRKTDD